MAHLGGLGQRRQLATIALKLEQGGLGRGVVVPQIVVDELVVPHHLAVARIERHH